MKPFRPTCASLALLLLFGSAPEAPAAPATAWRFAFDDRPPTGFTRVLPEMAYAPQRGFGFEAGTKPAGEQPFFFSADVPEGNYRVTAALGDERAASDTTIKAELRRLMIEHVVIAAGKTQTVSFVVNVRTPKIGATGDLKEGAVKLKAPRETEQEAWAWDEKLTLEINGARPALRTLEIQRVDGPTIFLLGDSTVCDQPREPFASWGQMLPRFFRPAVAVANHGESGESYSASLGRRRIDKIVSALQRGDVVVMQFGHNDQKERGEGTGPFLNYKQNIKRHVTMIRSRGGIPVIVSPMERRAFDDQGKVRRSLADYAEAARQAATENACAFIDLNAISVPFYETLEARGKDFSRRAFAGQDNTHHNNYGAYELAKAIAQGLRDAKLEVAKYLVDDFRGFDPRHPDPVEAFALPASPGLQGTRPLGN